MHLFLKKIYRKNPFPKIYRINQCEVLIDRYLNLLAFGKQFFPRQYAAYISELGMGDRIEMKFTLPDYYNNIKLIQNIEQHQQFRPPLQINRKNAEMQKKIKISRKGKY